MKTSITYGNTNAGLTSRHMFLTFCEGLISDDIRLQWLISAYIHLQGLISDDIRIQGLISYDIRLQGLI